MHHLFCVVCGQELKGDLDTWGRPGEELCFSCFIALSDIPVIIEEYELISLAYEAMRKPIYPEAHGG